MARNRITLPQPTALTVRLSNGLCSLQIEITFSQHRTKSTPDLLNLIIAEMHYSQPEPTLREALLADSAQSWETEALAHSRGWQSMGSLACTLAQPFTARFHKRLSLAATSFGQNRTRKTQRTWAAIAAVLMMFHLLQLKTCPAHPRAVTFLGTTLTMHMYKVLS